MSNKTSPFSFMRKIDKVNYFGEFVHQGITIGFNHRAMVGKKGQEITVNASVGISEAIKLIEKVTFNPYSVKISREVAIAEINAIEARHKEIVRLTGTGVEEDFPDNPLPGKQAYAILDAYYLKNILKYFPENAEVTVKFPREDWANSPIGLYSDDDNFAVLATIKPIPSDEEIAKSIADLYNQALMKLMGEYLDLTKETNK